MAVIRFDVPLADELFADDGVDLTPIVLATVGQLLATDQFRMVREPRPS